MLLNVTFFILHNNNSHAGLVNDLGVNIGSSLHFYKHRPIDRIVAKVYSRIDLLFRIYVSNNFNVFKQAYITLDHFVNM